MKTLNLFSILALSIAITLLFVVSGCNNDDDDTTPDTPENPAQQVLYFFRGDIDGAMEEIEVTALNEASVYNSHSASLGLDTCVISYGSFLEAAFEEEPAFGIDLENFYIGACSLEYDVFQDLFNTQSLPFAQDGVNSTENSAIVSWSNNDKFYSSAYGEQTNSTFTITNLTFVENAFGKFYDVEGTTNCKMYNTDNPAESITLENAEFKVSIAAYNN